MNRLSVSKLYLQVIIYIYSCPVISVGKPLSTLGVLLNGNYCSEFLMFLVLQLMKARWSPSHGQK